jgi:rhamnosyltransferase
MQHVFIVGSKGIPAAYGGFETFVEKLTAYRKSKDICYHVARLSDKNGEYEYNGAQCFDVKVPSIGPAKAVYYDMAALRRSIRYLKEIQNETATENNEGASSRPVFYVLACRIGPFIGHFRKQIHKLGGVLYVNPDGHEWMRSKWSAPIRKYWKISEKLMVKHADLLICDSKNIENYIKNEYSEYRPGTTFIAYGSDTVRSKLDDEDADYWKWLAARNLKPGEYYLVVGRFVPENNFRTMIKEFLNCDSTKALAIITTPNETLYDRLDEELHFSVDSRICFAGTVYEEELLKKIRENAYGYIHGHEVGGTNPSLLEALGSTKLNLLLKVGFNEEVAQEAALYWDKTEGSLAECIHRAETMEPERREQYGDRARKRIQDAYSWDFIVEEYEALFQKA